MAFESEKKFGARTPSKCHNIGFLKLFRNCKNQTMSHHETNLRKWFWSLVNDQYLISHGILSTRTRKWNWQRFIGKTWWNKKYGRWELTVRLLFQEEGSQKLLNFSRLMKGNFISQGQPEKKSFKFISLRTWSCWTMKTLSCLVSWKFSKG